MGASRDDSDPPDSSRFALIPFADVAFSSGQEWLVKGLLASTGLATIFGPAKNYKSFVALDLGLAVASGKPWAGRRVRQGAVVFIVAEGATGFMNRVAGNRQKFGYPPDLPFFLIFAKPDLGTGKGDTKALTEKIAPVVGRLDIPLAAIFIDTLVRTLAGSNENDEGMRNFTDNAEAIAAQFACIAIAVHHTGKDVTRGMRGSSALQAAVVSSWRVEKPKNLQARITLEDAKDGESALTWTADLERYVYGLDEDGDEKSILVVSAVSKPVLENQTAEDGGKPAEADGDRKVKLLQAMAQNPAGTQREWAEATGIPLVSLSRTLGRLEAAKMIEKDLSDAWRITAKGKKELAKLPVIPLFHPLEQNHPPGTSVPQEQKLEQIRLKLQ